MSLERFKHDEKICFPSSIQGEVEKRSGQVVRAPVVQSEDLGSNDNGAIIKKLQ